MRGGSDDHIRLFHVPAYSYQIDTITGQIFYPGIPIPLIRRRFYKDKWNFIAFADDIAFFIPDQLLFAVMKIGS